MKKTIHALSLLLAAALLLTSVGCLVKEEATVTDTQTVAAHDRDATAVTLGSIKITAGEVEDMYNSYIEMFSYYGMTAPTDDDSISEYVQYAIEGLLADAVYQWKAEQMGLVLTDAELQEVDARAHEEADAEYEYLVLYYAANYSDAGYVETLADLTQEQLDETLYYLNQDIYSYYGDEIPDIDVYFSMMYDEYYKAYVTEAYQAKLREKVDADVTVDDATVDAWYEDTLEEQKTAMDSSPANYRTYREDVELGYSSVPILYVPEGIAVVKVITVETEGELPAEISEGEARMAEIEAAYGKLVLNGGSEEEQQALKDEYVALAESVQALKDEYYGAAAATANGLSDRLAAGESFDAVAASVDESFTKEQVIYLNDTDYAFPDAVREAVAAMEDGTYSAAIEVSGTYYLVYRVGMIAAGAVDRSTVEEAVRAAAASSAKDAAWDETVAAWEEEAFASAIYNKAAYAYIGH